ncbi:MAG: YggT family protein [Firmicutes bacterium]|nr:YggT family protein [Bacillota bacterium]
MLSLVFGHLAASVALLERVFFVVLLVRIVASFFPPRSNGVWNSVAGFSVRLTEPVLAPIRRRIPLMGVLDLSPLIAFFLVDVVGFLLSRLFLFAARI